MERITAALRSVWESSAPTQPSGDVPFNMPSELQPSRRPESISEFRPFVGCNNNVAWAAACLSDETMMLDDWESLADLDSLEPHPATRKQTMANERLRPFWLGAEKKEMDGLWPLNGGCFERVKRSELPRGTRVFGSRFRYKIKRHTDTMQVKSTKVRLVVQGQRTEQGVDFEDTFAPVPRTTAAHAHGVGGRRFDAPAQP
eukprot:1239496-Rhodomonas_salina.2